MQLTCKTCKSSTFYNVQWQASALLRSAVFNNIRNIIVNYMTLLDTYATYRRNRSSMATDENPAT